MARSGRPIKVDPRVDNMGYDIAEGRYEAVKNTLKELGVDAIDSYKRTALINATIENKIDLVHWLVDNGAYINYQDNIGFSALHFAAQEKNVALARYLLENGANPNLKDIHGNAPLWVAIFNSKLPTDEQGVVQLLLKFGADHGLVNNYGKTPAFIYKIFHCVDISTVAL